MNKKSILIVFLILIPIGLHFLARPITIWIFNQTHQNLCINTTCFEKPKDWLPKVVKKNNEILFLDFIPRELLFWNKEKILDIVNKDAVFLTNNENNCLISEYNNLSDNVKLILRKTNIDDCKIYIQEGVTEYAAIYLDNKHLKLLVNTRMSVEKLKELIVPICK